MADDTIAVQVVADTSQAITNLAGFAARAIGLTNDLARMAHEAQETQNAINSLGSAYSAVQSSTAGAVSATQAFRAQQQLQEAGMTVSADGLAVLTRRARDYANATNTDLSTALDRVTNAITTGSGPALQRLGVHLQHSATGGRASAEALRQWRAQQSGAAPEAQNLAEAADANARAWHDFTTSMAAAAAQAINLRGILASLREATGGLGEAIRNGLAQVGIGAGGEETQRRNTERSTEQLRLQIAEDAARRGAGRIAGLDRLSVAQLYAVRERLARGENPNAAVADASALGRTAIAADQAAAASAGTEPLVTGGRDGGGGGGGSNPLREALHAAAELRRTAAAAGLLDAVEPMIERRPGERPAAWKRRLELLAPGIQQGIQEELASRQAARQASDAAIAQWHANQLQQNEARGRQLERATVTAQNAVAQGTLMAHFNTLSPEARARVMRERQQTGQDVTLEGLRTARAATDVGRQLENTFTRTATFAQNLSGAVSGAFEGMTQSLTNHVSALVEGRENIGQAMLGIAHEVSMGIATRSLPLAIFELASGVAAQAATLGVPNPISVAHFTSAAMFGALAAGGFAIGAASGAGLAAMNAGASSGGASQQGAGLPRGPASTGAMGAGGHAGGNVVVVNFNGAPIHTREEVQETVVSAANIGRSRGAFLEAEVMDRRRRAA